jgi:hypothetical protein
MQFWDRDPSPDVVTLMDHTKAVCAQIGLPYTRFDETSGRAALAAISDEAVGWWDRAFHPAMKADILRLHWLHAHGGYYCDADLTITPLLPTVLPSPTVLWVDGRVANAFMFTVPGTPYFAYLIKRMHGTLRQYFKANGDGPHDAADVILLTGPAGMRDPTNDYFARHDDRSVRFVPKRERRAYVTPGTNFLHRVLDYKADGRSWHADATGPSRAKKAEQSARRRARAATASTGE